MRFILLQKYHKSWGLKEFCGVQKGKNNLLQDKTGVSPFLIKVLNFLLCRNFPKKLFPSSLELSLYS